MKKFFLRLKDESGQAAIEYILILTVVVSIILGGLYQLNDAFRVFANNYFGEYLSCLLETGEVPSFGGSTTGECNQGFKPFSITDGRPMVGGALTGEETSGGSDGASGGSSGEKSSEGSSSSNGGTTIAQSMPAGGFTSGSGSNRFRVNRTSTPSAGEEAENESSGISGGGVTDLSGGSSGRMVRIPIRQAEKIRGSAKSIEEEEKEKKTKVTQLTEESTARSGPQMIKVDRNLSSNKEAPTIEEFSFGDLFRLLIISAIVIAIIIFIGGQILQVSKSMD